MELISYFFNIFDKEEEEIVYEILEPLPFEKILNLYKEKALEIIDRLKENGHSHSKLTGTSSSNETSKITQIK